ncbi:MAG: hypothetical protein ACP5KW_10850 [Thermoproteota archaeon]
MNFVIDEWIYYYFKEERKYEILEKFLKAILDKCDKVIIARGVPLAQKIYAISKESQEWEPKRMKLAKKFFGEIIKNTTKCEFIDKLAEFPKELFGKVKNDDRYLISMALTKKDSIILTTDRDLKSALQGYDGLKVELFEEFLQSYLKDKAEG